MEDFDGFIDDNIAFVDVSTDNCSLFVKVSIDGNLGMHACVTCMMAISFSVARQICPRAMVQLQ